jgi:lipopolysaccharide export LptBFGC system permease protein LptF
MADEMQLDATGEPIGSPVPVPVSAELLQKILEQGNKELELKVLQYQLDQQNALLREKNLTHNKELAEKSIDANLQNAQLERQYDDKKHSRAIWLLAAVVLSVTAIAIGFLLTNNAAYLKEILIALIFGAGGTAGGYQWGKSKAKEEALKNAEDNKV